MLNQFKKNIKKTTRLKISNYDINNVLEEIGKQMNLPIDIQTKILNYSMNKMNNKLKTDLIVFLPRLKKVQKDNRYIHEIKVFTTKLFLKLPHKYKKAYILALEDMNSICFPKLLALIFLSKYWHEIVRYIGNRNESISNDVYEFIIYYYGELAIPLPSQVKFRNIISNICFYFDSISNLTSAYVTNFAIENMNHYQF